MDEFRKHQDWYRPTKAGNTGKTETRRIARARMKAKGDKEIFDAIYEAHQNACRKFLESRKAAD